MIRINLLPHKEARKRKSGQQQIIVFVLAFALEIGALVYYMNHKESGLKQFDKELNTLQTEITGFKSDLARVQLLERRKKALQKREQIQKVLEVPGPENILLFLSYVLRPESQIKKKAVIDPEGTGKDPKRELGSEADALYREEVKWKRGWDPNTVYLETIIETGQGSLSITGTAKSIGDVAEFIKRIGSAPFFKDIKAQRQTIVQNTILKVEFVRFGISCKVDYSAGPLKK